MEKGIHRIVFITIPFLIVGGVYFYLNFNYHKLDTAVESINIVLDKPFQQSAPVAYILDSTEAEITHRNPIASKVLNDSILRIDLERRTKLRQFRIYFAPSLEPITIRAIRIHTAKESDLDMEIFTSKQIEIIKKEKNELSFKILASNGYSYIESPKFYYPTDYPFIVPSIVAIILVFCLLFIFAKRIGLFHLFSSLSFQELSVIVFIISIFLPQRYFNIALITTILLHIKNFKIKVFLANKLNLYFVALYGIILISFFVISFDYYFKAIEKYTLLLILPIYLSSIRSGRLGIFLCFSAIAIGGVLLFGSLIDIAVFRNLEIMSFESFTGPSIHPVYYSYLIAFSIFYVQITMSRTYKYVIQLFLVLLLIFCGSKLIIISTLLLLVFQLNRQVSFVIIPLMVVSLFVFTPMKKRLGSIIDPSDLSVIDEKHIDDPNDPRLNGFTIRLILWQESLDFTNIKDLLLGRGAGSKGDQYFEQRLERRGLTNHLFYNSHNQYVTALFETGLVGLIMLVLLLTYVIRWAIKNNDRVLLTFTILMSIAMLTESVLEKASGIALFCTIILSLMNTKLSESRVAEREVAEN